jgi:hypothetical protein
VRQEPVYENYLDAPQTPGNWSYSAVDGGTIARFGEPGASVFAIGCMQNSRRVVLIREAIPDARDALMAIRTETAERRFEARPGDEGGAVSTALGANDPLLDAMAVTKGRFAVGVEGEPTLYLPAWVEVTRVIEDCR